jgi:hypothetical protein
VHQQVAWVLCLTWRQQQQQLLGRESLLLRL